MFPLLVLIFDLYDRLQSNPKAGSHFIMHKQPVPGFNGGSLAKMPHIDTKIESHHGDSKSCCGESASSTNSRKKRSHG